MKNRITPNNIKELRHGEIFVFGSNLAGRHGAGAAKTAVSKFRAKYGQSSGLQGNSYAIPTKDARLNTLSEDDIKNYVDEFISFASNHPSLTFLVTEIGCGLAFLTPYMIAPMFKGAINVNNIHLPESFWKYLLPPTKVEDDPFAIARVSTLDGQEINPARRSGNTSRLVDRAIQIIFNGDICVVRDHTDNGESKLANHHLMQLILMRLNNEHSSLMYYGKIVYDIPGLEIKML